MCSSPCSTVWLWGVLAAGVRVDAGRVKVGWYTVSGLEERLSGSPHTCGLV